MRGRAMRICLIHSMTGAQGGGGAVFGLRRDSGGDRLVYTRAKRQQRQLCHLERLQAKGDTDDGDAVDRSGD